MTDAKPAGNDKDPSTDLPLDGYQKAAILIIVLGQQLGAKLLGGLDRLEMERVTRAISQIQRVSSEHADHVLSEYIRLVKQQKFQLTGGFDKAMELLANAKGDDEAARFKERFGLPLAEDGLAIIRQTDLTKLVDYVKKENPQVGALVVAHLDEDQAAFVMGQLASDHAIDLAFRISQMDSVDPELIREIALDLVSSIGEVALPFDPMMRGPAAIASILNAADSDVETTILSGIQQIDEPLADQIRDLLFTFNDFMAIDDRALQVIIQGCSKGDLALALKNESDELIRKFTSNMSERAQEMLMEDMELLGPVLPSQIKESQSTIIATMRQLQHEGKVVIVKEKRSKGKSKGTI